MTFNDEQMEVLSQWEANFRTATEAHWSRGIGTPSAETIHKIYSEATGKRLSAFRPSCGQCVLRLLQTVGKVYFADKQERIDKANDAKMVELSLKEAKTVKKTVKTRKKKTENAV